MQVLFFPIIVKLEDTPIVFNCASVKMCFVPFFKAPFWLS